MPYGIESPRPTKTMGPDKTTCLTIPAKSRALEGIRHYILSHDLQAGDCLPPERDLAQMLGVSRTALRGAIAALVGSYELTSRQGSGTYVADRPLVEVFQEMSSYTDAGQKSGVATSSRVLESRLTTASASRSHPTSPRSTCGVCATSTAFPAPWRPCG